MEVHIHTISDVLQEAEITVSHDELQPHFDKAYQEYRPKVEVRGFRKGKVPLEMIRKLYGDAIEHDALDTVANAFYEQAMIERNIQPIGRPSMTDMDFRRGEHFRFKIKYEIKPDVELTRYKGLKLEKPVHRVTEAEVDAEILNLRRMNASMEEVRQVAGEEFVVTADVQELDQTGAPLIGKRTSNARLHLYDKSLVAEIRTALAGAETGGVYRATFESQHGDHTHPVHLSLSVRKIEAVHLPEFNEELVKKVTKGNVSSTEEFREGMRRDIQKYWDDQSERAVADALAGQIVDEHQFTVPESLITTLLDSYVEDMKGRSKDRKLPQNFDEARFREESRAYAIRQAKWMLLKERIAEAEGITVSEEEIENLAAADAARLNMQKEQILQYYRTSGSVADRLLSDKIMAFLKSHAKITEREQEIPAQ